MDYNKLSETKKDVSKLEHMDKLDANTDEVESKLDAVIAGLTAINLTLQDYLGNTNGRLNSIASKLDTANGYLLEIDTNTKR